MTDFETMNQISKNITDAKLDELINIQLKKLKDKYADSYENFLRNSERRKTIREIRQWLSKLDKERFINNAGKDFLLEDYDEVFKDD